MYLGPRVNVQVTVDMLKFGSEPTWEVSAVGLAPHDHRRSYTIRAKTDNDAAKQGMAKFIEEMEALYREEEG